MLDWIRKRRLRKFINGMTVSPSVARQHLTCVSFRAGVEELSYHIQIRAAYPEEDKPLPSVSLITLYAVVGRAVVEAYLPRREWVELERALETCVNELDYLFRCSINQKQLRPAILQALSSSKRTSHKAAVGGKHLGK